MSNASTIITVKETSGNSFSFNLKLVTCVSNYVGDPKEVNVQFIGGGGTSFNGDYQEFLKLWKDCVNGRS